MPGIGDVLAGKYRLLAKLGEGGMGAVFHAENTVTGKHVAVKWMHPHTASHPDASARLLREAQATSRLRHPHVVDVYDLIQDGPAVFLVMELLEGETVGSYLRRTPQPKISEFIALMLPALEGVAAAHTKGVIHRDLKPENIFLVRSGSGFSAKVVDFGIAKVAEGKGALTLTQTGAAIGTPMYMSLEQLRGDKEIDARTDVYAFGVIFYEALTGRMPYEAETLTELAIKIATTAAVPVKSRRSDVPTALASIIDWAVAKERSQRLPSVEALIRELEPFARDTQFRNQMTNPDVPLPRLAHLGQARADLDGGTTHAADTTQTATALPAPSQPLRRSECDIPDTLAARELLPRRWKRRTWPLGVGLASAIIAGGLTVWLTGNDEPAAQADQADQAEAPAASQPPAAASPTAAVSGRPPASAPAPTWAAPRPNAPIGPDDEAASAADAVNEAKSAVASPERAPDENPATTEPTAKATQPTPPASSTARPAAPATAAPTSTTARPTAPASAAPAAVSTRPITPPPAAARPTDKTPVTAVVPAPKPVQPVTPPPPRKPERKSATEILGF
ncbi:MAG: protein kinase [Polyangiales bacterium]